MKKQKGFIKWLADEFIRGRERDLRKFKQSGKGKAKVKTSTFITGGDRLVLLKKKIKG